MLNIKETLNNFQKLKVLIIGDVMLDRYLHGQVERISPEAPVPIVALSKKTYSAGGAANVALNVAALGAKPFLLSTIGMDKGGDRLIALLSAANISTKYLQRSKNRRTTVKTRVLAQNQQMLRFDEEDNFDLTTATSDLLLHNFTKLLEEIAIDVILFQDYNKGVLTDLVIREVLFTALKLDIPTVVDPKNKNFFAYKRVTLFKPNLKEINDNLPFQSNSTLSDLKKAATYLTSQLNNTQTLITLSDKGVFYSHQQNQNILPTIPRNIADVCGAGDSVVSIAALGIALKLPIAEIAQLANLAGGQVCEKVGVVPVSVVQLEQDYLNLK
ncbi:MAG: bifunctional heptose 7-phosphate kinase/heptose 1-phosphate adenyltransferase [Saprospiraceae bacterium]